MSTRRVGPRQRAAGNNNNHHRGPNHNPPQTSQSNKSNNGPGAVTVTVSRHNTDNATINRGSSSENNGVSTLVLTNMQSPSQQNMRPRGAHYQVQGQQVHTQQQQHLQQQQPLQQSTTTQSQQQQHSQNNFSAPTNNNANPSQQQHHQSPNHHRHHQQNTKKGMFNNQMSQIDVNQSQNFAHQLHQSITVQQIQQQQQQQQQQQHTHQHQQNQSMLKHLAYSDEFQQRLQEKSSHDDNPHTKHQREQFNQLSDQDDDDDVDDCDDDDDDYTDNEDGDQSDLDNDENQLDDDANQLSGQSRSRNKQRNQRTQRNRNNKQNTSLYKTEMCRTFAEGLPCPYGDRCMYSHGNDEIRKISRHPRYKTEVCKNFQMGYCKYGTRCVYLHEALNPAVSGLLTDPSSLFHIISQSESLKANQNGPEKHQNEKSASNNAHKMSHHNNNSNNNQYNNTFNTNLDPSIATNTSNQQQNNQIFQSHLFPSNSYPNTYPTGPYFDSIPQNQNPTQLTQHSQPQHQQQLNNYQNQNPNLQYQNPGITQPFFQQKDVWAFFDSNGIYGQSSQQQHHQHHQHHQHQQQMLKPNTTQHGPLSNHGSLPHNEQYQYQQPLQPQQQQQQQQQLSQQQQQSLWFGSLLTPGGRKTPVFSSGQITSDPSTPFQQLQQQQPYYHPFSSQHNTGVFNFPPNTILPQSIQPQTQQLTAQTNITPHITNRKTPVFVFDKGSSLEIDVLTLNNNAHPSQPVVAPLTHTAPLSQPQSTTQPHQTLTPRLNGVKFDGFLSSTNKSKMTSDITLLDQHLTKVRPSTPSKSNKPITPSKTATLLKQQLLLQQQQLYNQGLVPHLSMQSSMIHPSGVADINPKNAIASLVFDNYKSNIHERQVNQIDDYRANNTSTRLSRSPSLNAILQNKENIRENVNTNNNFQPHNVPGVQKLEIDKKLVEALPIPYSLGMAVPVYQTMTMTPNVITTTNTLNKITHGKVHDTQTASLLSTIHHLSQSEQQQQGLMNTNQSPSLVSPVVGDNKNENDNVIGTEQQQQQQQQQPSQQKPHLLLEHLHLNNSRLQRQQQMLSEFNLNIASPLQNQQPVSTSLEPAPTDEQLQLQSYLLSQNKPNLSQQAQQQSVDDLYQNQQLRLLESAINPWQFYENSSVVTTTNNNNNNNKQDGLILHPVPLTELNQYTSLDLPYYMPHHVELPQMTTPGNQSSLPKPHELGVVGDVNDPLRTVLGNNFVQNQQLLPPTVQPIHQYNNTTAANINTQLFNLTTDPIFGSIFPNVGGFNFNNNVNNNNHIVQNNENHQQNNTQSYQPVNPNHNPHIVSSLFDNIPLLPGISHPQMPPTTVNNQHPYQNLQRPNHQEQILSQFSTIENQISNNFSNLDNTLFDNFMMSPTVVTTNPNQTNEQPYSMTGIQSAPQLNTTMSHFMPFALPQDNNSYPYSLPFSTDDLDMSSLSVQHNHNMNEF